MPYADLGDFRLHYVDIGPDDESRIDYPPVVFLHGFTLDHRQWREVVPFFRRRYRVILMDARGHGLSDAPETGYSRAHRVDDLARFVDTLNIGRFHLVGLSMGGSTAIAYAFRHQACLESLTLASSSAAGWNIGTKMKRIEQQAREKEIAESQEKGLEFIRRKWIDYSLAFFEKTGKEPPEMLVTMMQEHSGAPWMDERRGRYPAPGIDLDRVHGIDVPTLILAGGQDKIFSALAVELHRRIPDNRLKVYRQTGHMLNMERPDRFNQDLADFLSELEAQ